MGGDKLGRKKGWKGRKKKDEKKKKNEGKGGGEDKEGKDCRVIRKK